MSRIVFPEAFSEPEDAGETVYDRKTIVLHWTTVVLVVLLWLIGRLTGFLPRGALRVNIWSVHVLLGFALAIVLAVRIRWRTSRGRSLAPSDRGIFRLLATGTHRLLYLLLVLVVCLGLLNVFAHAFPLFNLWSFPKMGDDAFKRDVNDIHGLVANLIAAIALLHAGAALFHHHVLGDGVLRRMWPGR